MGIYIPNMEMPKTCQICRTAKFDRIVGCEEWDRLSIAQRMYIRSETCPLIPIPEGHGRLIDADKLDYTMLYKENWMRGTGVEAPAIWKSDIDAAPTIVPAEGGQTNEII